MEGNKEPYRGVWAEYEKGVAYNRQIGLYDTVRENEDFFIGRQWEGVQANGLPTPVFNYLKRVILHRVSSVVSDQLTMNAAVQGGDRLPDGTDLSFVANLLNRNFSRLFEQNKLGALLRDYMRNASVDGDGCLYTWFDPGLRSGGAGGDIVTEVVENTRVIFGNPNDRRVERQPYIIIARREPVEQVRRRVKAAGGNPDDVRSDTDDAGSCHDGLTSGEKCTVLLKFFRKYRDAGRDRFGNPMEKARIMALECVRGAAVREEWDTGLTLYPVTWLCAEYVQNSYHGQADATSLIPNQVFINKLFAMTMLSLMTSAYPKVVYDKTRIAKWDNRIGAAIPVSGGDMKNVADIIDPAQISPQVSQFIEAAIRYTKECMGATDAALGEAASYNTSALIANQRAAGVPLELLRQNLYQSVEDLGRIYIDHMRAYYGERAMELSVPGTQASAPMTFDYSLLGKLPLAVKLDVGASAYWSEITAVQTLDNLLRAGKIDIVQYLERLPAGYITGQKELAEEFKKRAETAQAAPSGAGGIQAAGLDQLRRAVSAAAGGQLG